MHEAASDIAQHGVPLGRHRTGDAQRGRRSPNVAGCRRSCRVDIERHHAPGVSRFVARAAMAALRRPRTGRQFKLTRRQSTMALAAAATQSQNSCCSRRNVESTIERFLPPKTLALCDAYDTPLSRRTSGCRCKLAFAYSSSVCAFFIRISAYLQASDARIEEGHSCAAVIFAVISSRSEQARSFF